MNKKLILAAVLCMGALVSCGNKPAAPVSSSEKAPDSQVSTPDNSVESTPVTVTEDGSEAHPYSVAKAYDLCAALADKTFSESPMFVKGLVIGEVTFNSKYSSYTFNIGDKATDTNVLKIYSATLASGVAAPQAGDTVTVYGSLENYNGTMEMAGYATNNVAFPEVKVNTVGASHTDTPVDSSSSVETPVETITGDKMMYDAGVTANMVLDANNAETVKLDPAVYTVNTNEDASDYKNKIGLNKDGTIRVYNGNELTITVASGTIGKIQIVYASGYSGLKVFAGETELTGTTTYTVNAATVTIKNDSGKQVRVDSIIIEHLA